MLHPFHTPYVTGKNIRPPLPQAPSSSSLLTSGNHLQASGSGCWAHTPRGPVPTRATHRPMEAAGG